MTTDTTRTPGPGRPVGSTSSVLMTNANAARALALQRAGATYDQICSELDCGKTTVIRLLAMARESIEPEKFTLPRTGKAPLEFTGRLRVNVSGETLHTKPGTTNGDFWTITIFDMPAGAHVVQIVYTKTYKGIRTQHHFATVTDDVAATLQEYDPLKYLQGFPPGERYAASQAKLAQASRLQYDTLVSQALADAPEALPETPQTERAFPPRATPRQIIVDLADAAGINPARLKEMKDGCDADRVYSILLQALETTSPGMITLSCPTACSKALDLAIDCKLGTRQLDG